MPRRSYHPIQSDEVHHLVGSKVLCAQQQEGLGYYATLIAINERRRRPYLCRLAHSKQLVRYAWIATL